MKTEKPRLPASGRPVRLAARCDARTRRGLTLVELLVSLGLIAFIALAFGTILGQARSLVSSSQSVIRANSAATAIAQVIREDLAGLSKEGFLAIYMPNPNEYHLVFTATGVFTDPTNATAHSNASVIDYGWTNPNTNTLWRRARPFINVTSNLQSAPLPAENIDGYLGLFRSGNYTPAQIDSLVTTYYATVPTNLPTPPVYSAATITDLWPILATECTSFRVAWLEPMPFRWLEPGVGNNLAIWTAGGGNWPAAIKVTFGLRMGDKTSDVMQYEVICPIMRD